MTKKTHKTTQSNIQTGQQQDNQTTNLQHISFPYPIYKPYLKSFPDEKGFFGKFGGSFLPESIAKAMQEIDTAYNLIAQNADFIAELRKIRKTFQGRPTPIYFAHNLTKKYGGAGIYLKREDLNHTGAHKLNHCMGEALLAKFMGKKKLIAETGAGQHGVALATAAAYFGLECEIHMGAVDIEKEKPNVVRMKILGAKVISVTFGAKTLKEAVDSAFESYLKDPQNTMYAIGSVVGPHPFPKMVRDFQSIVGIESKEQFLELTGELPDMVVACVGGGSNAMGIFSGFIDDAVSLVGIEPLGRAKAQNLDLALLSTSLYNGLESTSIHHSSSNKKSPIVNTTKNPNSCKQDSIQQNCQSDTAQLGEHAASLSYGSEGIMHGFNSIMLKDSEGNPANVHSIASGLDYPSVGPEHAYLHSIGRTRVAGINDSEAIQAFFVLSKNEGIIPAIESSHALAYALKVAPSLKGKKILINLSGRGDKDIDFVVKHYGYGE